MSTRFSAYYETNGVHIFSDLMEPDVPLFLEYSRCEFLVTIPLSQELSDIILAGLRLKREEKKNENICHSGI